MQTLEVLLGHGFAGSELGLHSELQALVLIQERAIGFIFVRGFAQALVFPVFLALLHGLGELMCKIIRIHSVSSQWIGRTPGMFGSDFHDDGQNHRIALERIEDIALHGVANVVFQMIPIGRVH